MLFDDPSNSLSSTGGIRRVEIEQVYANIVLIKQCIELELMRT